MGMTRPELMRQLVGGGGGGRGWHEKKVEGPSARARARVSLPSPLSLPPLSPLSSLLSTHVLSPSSFTLLASASVQEKTTDPMEMNRKSAMP